MSKWGLIILCLFPVTWILAIFMFFCGSAVDDMGEDGLSGVLGVDCTRYEQIVQWDTHEGFHGDGSRYVRLTFRGEEKQVLEGAIEAKAKEWSRIQAEGGGMSGKEAGERWYPLPMEENIQIAVYGRRTETDHEEVVMEPLVKDEACETPSTGKTLFPDVKEGFYFFLDRQGDDGTGAVDGGTDDNFLDRPSYNFTVALYDRDTGNLYYYELDT